MKTRPAPRAGRSPRRSLLIIAGVALTILIVAGVVLALRPAPLQKVAGALSGAVSAPPPGAVPPPGLQAGWSGNFSIRPASDDRVCLAGTTEALNAFQLKFHVRAYGCQETWNYAWSFVADWPDGGLAYQPRLTEVGYRDDKAKTGQYTNLYCLDVEGASVSNNATVTTFYCKVTDYQNQLWYLVQGSQAGQYKLYANQSRKCLAFSEALTESNHPYMVQKECNDAPEFKLQALEPVQ